MNKKDVKELVENKLLPLAEKEIKEKGIFHLYIYKDKDKFTCIDNQDEFTRSQWNNLNNMLIRKLKRRYDFIWDRGDCDEDPVQIFFINKYDKELFDSLKNKVDTFEYVWYYDGRNVDTLEMVENTDYLSKQSEIIKLIKKEKENKYENDFIFNQEVEIIYLDLIDYINDTRSNDEKNI